MHSINASNHTTPQNLNGRVDISRAPNLSDNVKQIAAIGLDKNDYVFASGMKLSDWCDCEGPSEFDVVSLIDENKKLKYAIKEWEQWYQDLRQDFEGVTDNRNDPQRLHDWNFIDEHRPAPERME
jgi:hypothetical protein